MIFLCQVSFKVKHGYSKIPLIQNPNYNRTPADNDSSAPESPRPSQQHNSGRAGPVSLNQHQHNITSRTVLNSSDAEHDQSINNIFRASLNRAIDRDNLMRTRRLNVNNKDTIGGSRSRHGRPPRTHYTYRNQMITMHHISSASEEAMLSDSANENSVIQENLEMNLILQRRNPNLVNRSNTPTESISLRTAGTNSLSLNHTNSSNANTNSHLNLNNNNPPPKSRNSNSQNGNKNRTNYLPYEASVPSNQVKAFYDTLHKNILKAAGSAPDKIYSTEDITPRNRNSNDRGDHSSHGNHSNYWPNLHLASYEIMLHALRIDNILNPGWQSRQYFNYESGIKNHTTDLGPPALSILQECWYELLTPIEAANVADACVKHNNKKTVETATKLSYNILRTAAKSLKENVVQKILAQCKKQSPKMLEDALNLVKDQAGISPELLFIISQEWVNLHKDIHGSGPWDRSLSDQRDAMGHIIPDESQAMILQNHHQTIAHQQVLENLQPNSGYPNSVAEVSSSNWNPHAQNFRPNNFYSEDNWSPNNGSPILHNPSPLGSNTPTTPTLYNGSGNMNFNQPPNFAYPVNYPGNFGNPNAGGFYPNGLVNPNMIRPANHLNIPNPPALDLNLLRGRDPMAMLPPTLPHLETYHLKQAFQAAKLALDSLGKRIANERKPLKYAEDPAYSNQIHQVLELSFKLGGEYLKEFCGKIHILHSPNLLNEIVLSVAQKLETVNRQCLDDNLKLLALKPIVKAIHTNYAYIIKIKANKIGGRMWVIFSKNLYQNFIFSTLFEF